MREQSLRYGLWQHYYLEKQFDAEAAFSCEGKTVMAIKYRQWRTKAFVLTRWQMQTVLHSDHEILLDHLNASKDRVCKDSFVCTPGSSCDLLS